MGRGHGASIEARLSTILSSLGRVLVFYETSPGVSNWSTSINNTDERVRRLRLVELRTSYIYISNFSY